MVKRAKLDGRVDLCVEVQTAERGLAWCRDTGTAWIVMDLIGGCGRGVAAYVISLGCTSAVVHVTVTNT